MTIVQTTTTTEKTNTIKRMEIALMNQSVWDGCRNKCENIL